MNTPTPRYEVKHYDATLSRKGQGVQVRVFTTRAEAERFALTHRLYAGPAAVKEILSDETRALMKNNNTATLRRCRLCREFHDAARFPELKGVCQDCWHRVQDWLTERGFTLVQTSSPFTES